MYAHVTDDQVDQVAADLPPSWRWPDGTTTTGFDRLDESDHVAAGWLPVDDQRPTPGDGQALGDTTWTVVGDAVVATADLVDLPPDEPDPLAQLLQIVGPEGVVRATVLGAHLTSRAGDLWDALDQISQANTARAAIEVVTDAALTAATTPLENP